MDRVVPNAMLSEALKTHYFANAFGERVPPTKKPRNTQDSAALVFANYVRLIFYFNVFDYAGLTGAGVIHADFIFRCQNAFHDVASSVDNPHWCVERE